MDTDINFHAYETVMELYPNRYNVGKKPTVKLYTDINRHAETQKKLQQTKTLWSIQQPKPTKNNVVHN